MKEAITMSAIVVVVAVALGSGFKIQSCCNRATDRAAHTNTHTHTVREIKIQRQHGAQFTIFIAYF